MDSLAFFLLAVLPVLTIVAGLNDIAAMKIPNWISIALVAAFFPTALVVGLSPLDLAIHLGIGAAALFAGMAMFAFRVIGGGDAKLLAAGCLWMGAAGTPSFLLFTALAGGAFSVLLIGARQFAAPYVTTGPRWMTALMEPKGDIPYGVAIAFGVLAAYPASDLVRLHLMGA
jgi:prepilin peptidase CpaA